MERPAVASKSITLSASTPGVRFGMKSISSASVSDVTARKPAARTAAPCHRSKRTGSGLSVKTKTFLLGKRMGNYECNG